MEDIAHFERSNRLAYWLHPEPEGVIAFQITQAAYELAHVLHRTQAQAKGQKDVQHPYKPRLREENHLQMAVFTESLKWEIDQESAVPRRQPVYQIMSSDMLVRYVKWLCMEGMQRGAFYTAIAVGCFLYPYSLEHVCEIAPEIFPGDNVRRRRKTLQDAFRQRFMIDFPPWQALASAEQRLVRESLAVFTPWGPYCGSDIMALGTDFLQAYFIAEAGSNDADFLDWDRIALLINPAVGIAHLRQQYEARVSRDAKIIQKPPMQRPAFPHITDARSDNQQDRERHNPPPFTPREQSAVKHFLCRQDQRRTRYRPGLLRVMANGQECACTTTAASAVGGTFQVPLNAPFLEVFGSDQAGDLLLAVFPIEPAAEERIFVATYRWVRIACTLPPIDAEADDADTIPVHIMCVQAFRPFLGWQALWSRVAHWWQARFAALRQDSARPTVSPDVPTHTPGLQSPPHVAPQGGRVTALSLPWLPDWGLVTATASGLPPQHHVFVLGDGEVEVTCTWYRAHQQQPAMLGVAWQGHLSLPGDFWLRFTQGDTPGALLGEYYLGNRLIGDETFTATELGFDPTHAPWTVTLLLKEPTA